MLVFEQASSKGMSQSQNKGIDKDVEFLKQYDHSIKVFSAFRTHRYAEFLADALYDKNGKLKSFEDWRYETRAIQDHFNRSWLETEYNTAMLRSEQAADWRRFEDMKEDFPCLKWMPTSSATPREEHAVFWKEGLTLPVDDPFWKEHYPGDQWNCKCYLEQTQGKPTKKSEMPEKKDMPQPAKGLDTNPGKKKEMFSRDHSYNPTKDTCIWLKLANGGVKSKLGKVVDTAGCTGDCNECKFVHLFGDKNKNKKLFEKLKDNDDYKNVKYDEATGALRAESKHHKKDKNKETFFNDENDSKGWKGTELEKKCQDTLFENGHSCILLPEGLSEGKGKEKTALDALIDGNRMDIKSITEEGDSYINQITKKEKQVVKWIKQDDDHVDSICLYFHEPSLFSEEKIKKTQKRINTMKNRGENFQTKHIHCVIKGRPDIVIFDI